MSVPPATEIRRLAEENDALKREVARQRSLVEASHSLHSTLDQDRLLGIILDTASAAVGAERGTVYLVSADGREIWSRVVAGTESLVIRLPLGRGIAGTVAKTGETIRIPDAYADPRFDPSTDKRSGFRTRSILCSPIRNRDGKVVGVFQLLNRRGGPFEDSDVEFLDALSVHAALAIENAVLHTAALEKERQEREIKAAQGIQRALLPERSSRAAGPVVLAGMNELCEDASGDYYDFVDLRSGRLGVAIGDVSGHGLGAAMVMAEARALLRAFALAVTDLPRLLDLINDFLSKDMTAGRFMTLFCAAIDPDTCEVSWASAGHNPVLRFEAATRTVQELHATGRVLGVFPDAGYEAGAPFRLAPGDALLLYTDGATEALGKDGELFGESRLRAVLEESAGKGAEGLLAATKAALVAWTDGKPPRDDLTLVAVTVPVEGGAPAVAAVQEGGDAPA
jgi:serine phosphatase RsbU (regulator of sigma subunit)